MKRKKKKPLHRKTETQKSTNKKLGERKLHLFLQYIILIIRGIADLIRILDFCHIL